MRRRTFLAGTGLAAASALAGCLGGGSPPPRKSNVVQQVEATDGKLRIALEDQTWVKSRYDASSSQSLADPDDGSGLSPVGGARAKGKGGSGGRGATGRASGGYSSAPKTRHGRAWYHGGDYADDWYENHSDEVTKYSVAVAAIGVGYIGSDFEMQDDPPEPGPIPWDCKKQDPKDAAKCSLAGGDGWYRVGAHVVGEDVNHDFRWECIDCKVEGTTGSFDVEKEWKVSPRI